LKHISHFWLYLSKSTSVFTGAEFRQKIKIKIQGNILLIFPFLQKITKISKENYLKFFHHIFKYSDFILVAMFYKLFFKQFKQVVKTFRHLMLNPSWDTSQ